VVLVSEEEVAAAFIAALAAANAVPYDYDEIPKPLPAYYTEVTVTRRFGGVMRGEKPTTTLYRGTTRAVAKNVTTAREMRRRAASLEGTTITVGGIVSTPIQFETEEPIGLDEGYQSGLTTWTWAI
jgi:hypothetical protein